MMRRPYGFALLLCLVPCSLMAADEPKVDPTTSELTEIRRTLQELVDLVRQSLRAQEAELVLKRLEIARRTIDPMERDLIQAQKDLDSVVETIAETTSMMEQVLVQVESAAEEGDGLTEDREQIRMMVDHWERRQETLERQRSAAEQRIIDLENRLRIERAQVATLEQRVDEALGLN